MKVRDAIAGVPRHSRGAAGCAPTEDVVRRIEMIANDFAAHYWAFAPWRSAIAKIQIWPVRLSLLRKLPRGQEFWAAIEREAWLTGMLRYGRRRS